MYSLLIVEDEMLEISALKKLITKNLPIVHILPAACNGLEGINSIRKYDPDIIILDIQMPYMNGLEILKELRNGGYSGQIIINTAYGEFNYVKDALNYGANAFLVKPEQPANILKKIRERIDAVEKERQKGDPLKQQNHALLGMAAYIAKEIINKITADENVSLELEAQLKELEIHFTIGFFLTIEIPRKELEKIDLLLENKRTFVEKIRNTVQRQLKIEAQSIVTQAKENMFSVFIASEELKSMLWFHHIAMESSRQIIDMIYQNNHANVRIGIGRPKASIGEFHVSFLESRQALYKTNETCPASIIERTPSLQYEMLQNQLKKIDLHDEREAVLNQVLNIYIQIIQHSEKTDLQEFRGLNATFWMMLLRFINSTSRNTITEENEKYFVLDKIRESSNCVDITNIIQDKIKTLIDNLYEDTPVYSNLIQKTIRYVQENYNTDISLEFTAGYLGISVPYLSYLFKKEMGQKFSDYLVDLRMQKLKMLINEKDYSISELCDLLGYRDTSYFCRVVKKATGKTVKELKQNYRTYQKTD